MIIPKVTSDRELGVWLVEHGQLGVAFPDSVWPYLDYAAIGAEYHSSHNGNYTPEGYVLLNESNLETAENEQSPITIVLVSHNDAVQLNLPCSDERLDQIKDRFGIKEFPEIHIEKPEFSNPYLTNLIPTDGVTVEDANELALCLRQIDENGDQKKFCAALDVEEPDEFSQALDIAMDLDDYEIITDNEYEYGRESLRRIGADEEILDALDGYTDFDRLGRAAMDEDGVIQSAFGLVRRLSKPFPVPESSQSDGLNLC